MDYGHEEVKVKFGKDPRLFSTLSKVSHNFHFQNPQELLLLKRNYYYNIAITIVNLIVNILFSILNEYMLTLKHAEIFTNVSW